MFEKAFANAGSRRMTGYLVCGLGTDTKVGEFPFLGWRSLVLCRIPLISSPSSWDLSPVVRALPLAFRTHKPYHVLSLFLLLLFHIKTHFF